MLSLRVVAIFVNHFTVFKGGSDVFLFKPVITEDMILVTSLYVTDADVGERRSSKAERDSLGCSPENC